MAFLFSRTGTYVSRTYEIVSARSHSSATESTYKEKGNEDDKHPYSKNMVSPSPVKVLSSADKRSARVQ